MTASGAVDERNFVGCMQMREAVLVTGGAGFIGAKPAGVHFVRATEDVDGTVSQERIRRVLAKSSARALFLA